MGACDAAGYLCAPDGSANRPYLGADRPYLGASRPYPIGRGVPTGCDPMRNPHTLWTVGPAVFYNRRFVCIGRGNIEV